MRALAALLLGFGPLLAQGQSPAPLAPPALGAATGAFFALSVADLDASARWYTEKLGLTPVMRADRMGRVAGVVVLEGGGLVVELVQHDDASRPSVAGPELAHGIFKAGVIVADFDRAVATLRARGVEIVIGPFPARATQRANVVFKDNAGNLIQLFGAYARP